MSEVLERSSFESGKTHHKEVDRDERKMKRSESQVGLAPIQVPETARVLTARVLCAAHMALFGKGVWCGGACLWRPRLRQGSQSSFRCIPRPNCVDHI